MRDIFVHCISSVIATKEAIQVVACAWIASFLAMTGRETAMNSNAQNHVGLNIIT
ncbi:MAG: hypothetical protein LBJ47_02375 [Tannerella sp.]|nr:hypothetical protein [Tannerella sp.]